MDSSAVECGVCCNVFSDEHCPRILPCTHTFCSHCIDGIIMFQRKYCPICRNGFSGNSSEDLIINRGLLDVAKQLSSKLERSSKRQKTSFEGINNDFRNKIIEKGISDCQKVESQIVDLHRIFSTIKDGILETNEEVNRHAKQLLEVQMLGTQILMPVDQKTLTLNEKLTNIQEEKKKFQDLDAKLKAATDFTSAGVVMDEAEEVLGDVQENIKEITDFIQKNKRDDVMEEVLTLRVKLKRVAEGILKSIEDFKLNIITVDALQRSCHGILQEDEPREVYAVKVFEGKLRAALINVASENKVFLSHLEERDVPPDASAVWLKSLLQTSSRRAFLELGVDGKVLGRIIIKVVDKGKKALNFLHMCAGDLGPSYANSQFVYVNWKGMEGENIGMGDYVTKGKTSREAVLSQEHWQREGENETNEEAVWKAGQVRGSNSYDCASRFDIVTRDHPDFRYRNCFGMVEAGLDVLRDLILQYSDIKRLRIINCGLLFSL